MCIETHILLYCPDCPNTHPLGLSLHECISRPAKSLTCPKTITRYTHQENTCPSCNPHEEPDISYINLLKSKLKLQVRFLEQTVGFPDPAGDEWGGFWKGLDVERRGLFVKVWSLEGEVEWVGEEVVRKKGVR